MLTAEIIQKMYSETGHVPVNHTTKKAKSINTNVSKEALGSILKEINAHNGFITTKTLEFKTDYARSTVQRVIALLVHQKKIQTKIVKNGRVSAVHVKGLNK